MQSYLEKSGHYFAHARLEIAPLLPKNCARVLEVGCGTGATLEWLRQSHRTVRTVGVDIAEAATEKARHVVDEVYCIDFERDKLPLGDQEFDLILCLDVLEHMVDPWGAVDRLVTQHLALGGTLIVSLPNVRHYSVVLPLLFGGRWTYEEAGLLDRTHLRFFTRESAKTLFLHPQLGQLECRAAGFEGWSLKRVLDVLTLGVFRDLVSYQYLFAVCRVG